MSRPEVDIPVVLNEKRGELFATQFMLAGSHEQFAADNASYMNQINFLEEAAAQLARSVSPHKFSNTTEQALRRKFSGYYNLDQIIADIRIYPQMATVHDYKMSGSKKLAHVHPEARTSTGKELIHTAIFHPFTLSFHTVEPESRGRQEKQIKNFFPNLHTPNPILFIDPIVTLSYPVTILTYGHTGRSKFGELQGTIATASARYVKTYADGLVEGVHTRTIRTWDVEGTQKELDFLLDLSMQLARARDFNAQNGEVIYSGDVSGNR